jgi:very-short-patch-repair endonuclease
MTKIPKALSTGEETLALQLRALDIAYQREVVLFPEKKKWRYDFLLPEMRVVIEVHGGIWHKGGHNTGTGLTRDYSKMNYAATAGYRTLQYSTEQVIRGDAILDVKTIEVFDGVTRRKEKGNYILDSPGEVN